MDKIKTNQEEKKVKGAKKVFVDVKDTFATSSTLIISAMTLVASLAWNEFFKAVFERFKDKLNLWGELIGLFLYALIVTLIVVVIVKRLKSVNSKVGGKSIK